MPKDTSTTLDYIIEEKGAIGWVYKNNFEDAIKVGILNKLLETSLVQDDRKQIKIADKNVIRLNEGWFIDNVENSSYDKILDLRKLSNFTFNHDTIDNYFNNLNDNNYNSTEELISAMDKELRSSDIYQENLSFDHNLMIMSDQGQRLQNIDFALDLKATAELIRSVSQEILTYFKVQKQAIAAIEEKRPEAIPDIIKLFDDKETQVNLAKAAIAPLAEKNPSEISEIIKLFKKQDRIEFKQQAETGMQIIAQKNPDAAARIRSIFPAEDTTINNREFNLLGLELKPDPTPKSTISKKHGR